MKTINTRGGGEKERPMSVQYHDDNVAAVITLDGRIRHDDLSDLMSAVNHVSPESTELRIQADNLTGIHFSCLQYLMATSKKMRSFGKRTQFVAPKNDFREVLMKLDILTYL